MSCVQELQLLEIMCSYFQEQSKDAIRQIIFSTLFSLQGNKADESRMAMLGKLVSMAIAVYRVPILECAATWLQVCNIRAFTLILSLLSVLMLKLQSITFFQNVPNVYNRQVYHESIFNTVFLAYPVSLLYTIICFYIWTVKDINREKKHRLKCSSTRCMQFCLLTARMPKVTDCTITYGFFRAGLSKLGPGGPVSCRV